MDTNPEKSLLGDTHESITYKIWALMLNGAFVFCVLFLAWPLLIIIWVLIKATSKGPGLFIQERVGKNNRIFECYKFRTMYQNTKQAGTHEIASSSITKIGMVLRKTKLDELPQAMNVLKNEMSLIGPRPCLPTQKQLIKERLRYNVLSIKPGISGWAQVNALDMSDPVKLAETDAKYLADRSIKLDIKIIIMTLKGILGKKTP